jgi:hypothetical protein
MQSVRDKLDHFSSSRNFSYTSAYPEEPFYVTSSLAHKY